jgi:hypothetical protein
MDAQTVLRVSRDQHGHRGVHELVRDVERDVQEGAAAKVLSAT